MVLARRRRRSPVGRIASRPAGVRIAAGARRAGNSAGRTPRARARHADASCVLLRAMPRARRRDGNGRRVECGDSILRVHVLPWWVFWRCRSRAAMAGADGRAPIVPRVPRLSADNGCASRSHSIGRLRHRVCCVSRRPAVARSSHRGLGVRRSAAAGGSGRALCDRHLFRRGLPLERPRRGPEGPVDRSSAHVQRLPRR